MDKKNFKERYNLQDVSELVKKYNFLNENGKKQLIEIWENSDGSYSGLPIPTPDNWQHTNTKASVEESLHYVLGMSQFNDFLKRE